MTFYVAQVNVARMWEPLDRPSMQAFVERLEPINAIADASPGFVWGLQTDDGDAGAKARLEWLRSRGSTHEAFTLRNPFPPPSRSGE